LPVSDQPQVVLNVEQVVKFFIGADHVPGREVAVFCDPDRRRDNKELRSLPPVSEEGGKHDARGAGGLAVLLADEEKEFLNQPAP
jgi:hypothetical protein